MVLISEITDDSPKGEGRKEEEEGRQEEEEEEEEEEGPKEEPEEEELKVNEEEDTMEKPEELAGSAAAAGEVKKSPAEGAEGSSAGQTLYNEYALRVAYIMRSYLYMRQGRVAASGGTSNGGGPTGEERCHAMMEVVRKERERWAVSRVMLEQTHPLEPLLDPADIAAVSPSCLPYLPLTLAPSTASSTASILPTTMPSPPISVASFASSPSSSPQPPCPVLS